MNSKHFRWPFLAMLAAPFFRGHTKAIIIGSTLSWTNGDYYFAGGTEPRAIAYALAIILLYAVFLFTSSPKPGKPMTSLLRRFVAFWIDFFLYLMADAPLTGSLITVMEWRRTGTFAWSFERTTPAPYDWWLNGLLVIFAFAAMAFYFALPLALSKPSPGSCIMGYQIVADDPNGLTLWQAIRRTFFGFKAVCSSLFESFRSRNSEQGKFWLDEKFSTRAVKLD